MMNNNLENYQKYENSRDFFEALTGIAGIGTIMLTFMDKTSEALPLCILTGVGAVGAVTSGLLAVYHSYLYESKENEEVDNEQKFILEKAPEFAQSRADFVQRLLNLDEYISDIKYPGYQDHLNELLALAKEYQKDGDYRACSPFLIDIEQRAVNAAANHEVTKRSE